MCWGFTTITASKGYASNKLTTGFQYTPVASIATCVTPQDWRQSANAKRSGVRVLNDRVSFTVGVNTVATMTFLWTSNPAPWVTTPSKSMRITSTRGELWGLRQPRSAQEFSCACYPSSAQADGAQQSGVLNEAGIRLLCELAASERSRSRPKAVFSMARSPPFFMPVGAPKSGHGRLLGHCPADHCGRHHLLTVPQGAVVALVGPSGSGKSSLLSDGQPGGPPGCRPRGDPL